MFSQMRVYFPEVGTAAMEEIFQYYRSPSESPREDSSVNICVRGLSKRFGKNAILDSLDFELKSESLVALIGTNGAGKTTLLKLLSTLYAPNEGEILFDGESLTRRRINLRARLHFLPDDPFFLSDNAIDHICKAALLYDRPLQEMKNRIVDWLTQFDLLEVSEKPIGALSRGQKYKVVFVGLLAANPELWLLDEPFAAGVDPTGIAAMKRHINKAVGAGATVIYSTQIVEIAEQFSSHLLVLHGGKLALNCSTRDWNERQQPFGLTGLFEQLRVAK